MLIDEVTGLPPFFAPRMKPYDKQLEVLRRSWNRKGYGLLMEMGTGKTKVAIDNFGLLHHAYNIQGLAIIASKSVYTNWTRQSDENPGEIQKHIWEDMMDDARIFTWTTRHNRETMEARHAILDHMSPGIRILAINVEALSQGGDEAYNLLRAFLRKFPSMLVVDESTLIKNPKSRRTKSILSLRDLAKYRRILTGYVSGGSPSDVYSQFEFLEQGLLGHRSFYTFRARYAVLREIHVGTRTIKTEIGTQNLDELAMTMAQSSSRIRKSECLDLPDKIYAPARYVELTPDQKRLYSELKRTAMAEIKKDITVTTQVVLTQVLRLQQVVCGHVRSDDGEVREIPSNRTNVLLEILEETSESTIIWCAFAENAHNVTKELGRIYGRESVARWYGAVPLDVREQEEADFQAKRRRFMVATQKAGCRGRTWTAGTLVIYYSNTTDLEERVQSEDRTHRGGQTESVTYINLVCADTVDEGNIRSLRLGRNVVDQIMQDGPANWI